MEALKAAIDARDVGKVVDVLFEVTEDRQPRVRTGYGREADLWDYKEGLPSLRPDNERAWASVAAHVAAFHNHLGGVLVFGIDDKTLSFVGTRDPVDAKRFNDKIRRYLGDKVWVEFSREFIQADQRYLGIAVVPVRGVVPLRFRGDAPPEADGSRLFSNGDLAVREGDSRRILRGPDADDYLSRNRLPAPSSQYFVSEPSARILKPDWDEFLLRDDLCKQVQGALSDDRTYITALTGVGGVGKTALACWAVIEAYHANQFSHFVSLSAKDRSLTPTGIQPIHASLASFDDLLNEILEVLGFSEFKFSVIEEREALVRELLPETTALLFIDNLETVDDSRVVQFLETLPKPAKSITTSRTARVRRAAFPIAVGPFDVEESIRFLGLHARRRAREYLNRASRAEQERVVNACSRIPLAIEWLVGHSHDLGSALRLADALAGSGARDEELLEFCFRRVHTDLPGGERAVLGALSLYARPQVLEAIAVACGLTLEIADAALSELEACSLAERVWDANMHDFAFRMLPLTRRFAYRELQRVSGEEQRIRRRLSDWYEGRDVPAESRDLMVAVRRGQRDPEAALVEAAIEFRRQGRVTEAETFFNKAIERNPKSWRAHREYGELLRDKTSTGAALDHYRIAAENAPAHGEHRALIFREYGMLLRQSGEPGAQARAASQFETALRETPNDPIVLHALANCYIRQSQYRRAQPILEKLIQSRSPETRARSYDLLDTCYEKTGEQVKKLQLRDKRSEDAAAASVELKSRRSVEGSARPLVPPDKRGKRSGH